MADVWGQMKLIYPFIRKNILQILAGIVCMVIVDITQLIIPQMIKQAVDILAQERFDPSTVALQCGFIILLGLVMALLRYGWRNLLMGSARNLENGIRNELFRHALTLDMAYYNRVRTGDIMAHATSDINHVRMAFGFGLIALVDTLLLGTATLAIMIWTHPRLTALAMIPMPFLILATRHLGRRMHDLHQTAQESFSKLTELVRESFAGIRIIKVYNFECLISRKVDRASEDYYRKNLKRAFVQAFLKPLLVLFLNLSTLIVVFYGGSLVIQKVISPGELVAFLQYLGILAWPIIAIGFMTNLLQRGLASLKRINKLLNAVPKVAPPDHPIVPSRLDGRIEFQGVGFGYEKDRPVLSDIHLSVGSGMCLGISGPPGSGKTSLVQLIPRLYDPDEGNIRIDGHELNSLDPDQLRQGIAFMPQESFLFSTTIRDNILLGRAVDQGRLSRVIEDCCLTETLAEMPDGLDTRVGEKGITLSGGQKQRIALARTLVVEKPVIILDDPVSQLDTNTASRVIRTITRSNPDAAMVIISHRISALRFCDRILILKNGRILHSGTHEELIETDRFYQESFRVQQFEERSHG